MLSSRIKNAAIGQLTMILGSLLIIYISIWWVFQYGLFVDSLFWLNWIKLKLLHKKCRRHFQISCKLLFLNSQIFYLYSCANCFCCAHKKVFEILYSSTHTQYNFFTIIFYFCASRSISSIFLKSRLKTL